MAIEPISTEIQIQLALEECKSLVPRARKELSERLAPIFANLDAQLAALREHVGMDEELAS